MWPVAWRRGGKRESLLVPPSALQLEEGTQKGIVMVIDGKNIAHKR